jgi:tetrapyrrole methylase family protein/MazG family protein
VAVGGDWVLEEVNLPEDYQTEFETLVNIVARLRAPQGCPWDRQQTHRSLREFLLDESYEVLEALDEEDAQKLCQELGDLMLQIVLHAQIAREKEEFALADLLRNINQKLVRRHPHIFGGAEIQGADEVAHNWEEIKKAERHPDASVLGSVPQALPSLAYSQEVQRRAAQSGFDWEDIEGVIEKLGEEVRELQQSADQSGRIEEFGDLLFTLVNIGRRMGIDSESALREANRKFYRRFRLMESLCRERGVTLGKLSFAAQNNLWEEAKKQLRRPPGHAPQV